MNTIDFFFFFADAAGFTSMQLAHQVTHNRMINLDGKDGRNIAMDMFMEIMNHKFKGTYTSRVNALIVNPLRLNNNCISTTESLNPGEFPPKLPIARCFKFWPINTTIQNRREQSTCIFDILILTMHQIIFIYYVNEWSLWICIVISGCHCSLCYVIHVCRET